MEQTLSQLPLGEVIIRVDHLNLWYDKDKPIEVHALKDITINIVKGDYVAFFGPSGCGKTTMLYAVTGIDSYQGGKVLINNKDLTGLNHRDLAYFRQTDIGIVFQQFNLVASLTVLQNVALPMIFRGVSSSDANIKAKGLIERLNLGQYAKRYPYELSGGQQQRVAIARAIANDPPIIIADEPLGNLDSVNAKNVLAFLKELNEKDGRTIIMVTHEAWSLQDVKTIFYMKDGVVLSEEKQIPGAGAEGALKHLTKEMGGEGKKEGGDGKEAEALSARAVANFLLRGYSFEEVKRFEEVLLKRLTSTIDDKEFYKEIHKPFNMGGIGLWKEKAERVVSYVKNIIETRKDITGVYKILETNPELPIKDEVYKIRNWLLEDYSKNKLDHSQVEAFDEAITDRLRGNISEEQFAKIISLPFHKFGVGFSSHTALALAQKFQVLLTEETKSENKAEENKTNEKEAVTISALNKNDFGKINSKNDITNVEAHKIADENTEKDSDTPIYKGHVLEKYVDESSPLGKIDKFIINKFKTVKPTSTSGKEK